MTESEEERFALANDLRLACQRIARRVRFESTSQVAPHQFSVLAHLHHGGAQTPGQLAALDRVSAPSMTRTVNCLEADGLVARVPHPGDGRQVLVELTAAGLAIITRTIASRDTWMAAHLEGLDDDQLSLLRKAADLLLEVSRA